jgi:thiol:disulfide interchange protein DsbD
MAKGTLTSASLKPQSVCLGRWVSAGFLVLVLCQAAVAGTPRSPIEVTAKLTTESNAPLVRVSFAVPPEHVIYAEQLKFQTEEGKAITPKRIAAPVIARDLASGREKAEYTGPFTAELSLDSLPATLVVKFQSCSNSACYFPEQRTFWVSETGVTATNSSPLENAVSSGTPDEPPQDWRAEASRFKVVARSTGFLKAPDFLSFLAQAQTAQGAVAEPMARYRELGLLATLLFIVIGGAGLNLTPCVLPLVPINLAIIGAGARAGSRRRGFVLGTIYGSGMALAYGALGLVVVLTGSKFGALNSSPWFNAAIAAIFVVLALAMFGFINIDFSRFQPGAGKPAGNRRGRTIFTFSLGVTAALLAGACVAPVVISVLVLSTQLYSQGTTAGLLLPFLLGLGMALPWPFAGAGLSWLPKRGRWMDWVKYSFGVLIIVFAAYYGRLAWRLFAAGQRVTALAAAPSGVQARKASANESLVTALRQARQAHRPLMIDFAASWCKNCEAMDEIVFKQERVIDRLKDFVVVRFDAEQPNQSPAREVLDRFGVIGLPTYVVLKLEGAAGSGVGDSAKD